MVRRVACALVALFVSVACISAADYTGKVTTINAKKGNITITYKDGDKEVKKDFEITFMSTVINREGMELKGKKRLASILKDDSVTITTEKKKFGDTEREIVTKVKVNKAEKTDK
jgi:hypothetical protein